FRARGRDEVLEVGEVEVPGVLSGDPGAGFLAAAGGVGAEPEPGPETAPLQLPPDFRAAAGEGLGQAGPAGEIGLDVQAISAGAQGTADCGRDVLVAHLLDRGVEPDPGQDRPDRARGDE